MKKKNEPEVVCGVLVVNEKGKILLVRSPKWKNCLVVPGGHVDYGEKIKDTAEREILEEVGIKTKFLKILLIQDLIFPKNFYKKKHFISIGCLSKALSSRTKKDGKEIEDIMWVKPEKALKLNLGQYTKNLINKYLKKR